MGLFSPAQQSAVLAAAERTKNLAAQKPAATKSASSLKSQLTKISNEVQEYFKDSQAILITSKAELHDYVTKAIASGSFAIDTETTGLDRINDWIVGVSLYYKGGVECYIPIKHIVPIFDVPYKNQLTYEEVGEELQRFVDAGTKAILANVDFDAAMIYKDMHVDIMLIFWYDVILAWRCIKENELHKDLKRLYNKYVLKGAGDPKRFSDFFPPALFPYCKPEIARLYAAHDAIITFELCEWQLPYVTKGHPKCTRHHFDLIADLIWNVEFPLATACQAMHRRGFYIDKAVSNEIKRKYLPEMEAEVNKVKTMVADVLSDSRYATKVKRPFARPQDFNPNSPPHVEWLVYDWLKLGDGSTRSTKKEVLGTYNHPIIKQLLYCRSLSTLIGTFVVKLPNVIAPDGRIHCQFKQIGADTGRMSSADPKRAYWGHKIKLIQGRATA